MILTGKAKKDFNKWYDESGFFVDLEYDLVQYALIIEFFSEQEYKIDTGVYDLWNYCFSNAYWDRGFKEHKQSVQQAIIKANEIYNEL